MNKSRKYNGLLAAMLAVWLPAVPQSQAQTLGNYPNDRPIRFIVPYTPGGSVDAVARALSDGAKGLIPQTILVETRAGAGGQLGASFVAKSNPDGYTLLVSDLGPIVIGRSVYENPIVDPVVDLVPVICASETALVLIAKPSLQVRSVEEFVARAKKEPGKLTYSSSGIGTILHMTPELFNLRAGTEMIHVPYRGGGPATLAVLSGEVDFGFMTMTGALPHIQAGSVRALGQTMDKPFPLAPDIPTIASQGYPGFDVRVWHAVMAPASTPAPVLEFLNAKLSEALRSSQVKDRLAAQGQEAMTLTPEQCTALVKRDAIAWAEVAKKRNIKEK